MRSLSLSSTLSILLFTISQATVRYVPSQYPTIQAAVNACSPGDTVQVAPGTYFENVLLTEGVTLRGSGSELTIIDGRGQNDVVKAYQISNVTIEGFTVQNSQQGGGSPGNIGIFLNPVSSTGTKIVRDCVARNCGNGIEIWNDFGGTAYIEHNQIQDNIYDGFSPYLGTVYLRNNTIVDNGRDGYNDWSGGGYIEFRNNIIANNGRYGIYKHRDTPVNIAYNDVWGNPDGNYMEGYSGPPWAFTPSPGTGEISRNPLFYGEAPFQYYLTWDNFPIIDPTKSPCIDAGDPSLPLDPDGTNSDMGCHFFNQVTADLDLTLEPIGGPIQIHYGSGGSFDYMLTIDNNETHEVVFDIWIKIPELGKFVAGPINLTIPANGSVTRTRTQNVPANLIPIGNYTYEVSLGSCPVPIWDSDSFPVAIVADNDYAGAVETVPITINPNPFNPSTVLSFEIRDAGFVKLAVYDVSGREVQVAVGSWQLAGRHEVIFDAKDLASGIYFAKLQAGDYCQVQKLVLMK